LVAGRLERRAGARQQRLAHGGIREERGARCGRDLANQVAQAIERIRLDVDGVAVLGKDDRDGRHASGQLIARDRSRRAG
jgi:hypothetical protein